ncbi:MAG: hypothetical protein KGJ33_00800 [Patescibacteria group bacterium]|nr:hypothetical protein [Patescibacteria group bacterium]
MIARRRTNAGLVKMLLVFFFILLIMAVLGLNLRAVVASPTFQDNWSFIRDNAVMVWDNYLRGPADYFWNNIFLPLIWTPTLNRLQHVQQATSTSATTLVPQADAAH